MHWWYASKSSMSATTFAEGQRSCDKAAAHANVAEAERALVAGGLQSASALETVRVWRAKLQAAK
jgi:hypothetical protein